MDAENQSSTRVGLPAASLTTGTVPLVIGLLMVDGLHFVFARLLSSYLPPVTSAFWVLGVGALEIAIYAAYRGQLNLATFRRHWAFFLAIGIFVGTSTAMTYTAVTYIDPGTASLLVETTTLFGLALGVVWLGERLTRHQAVGAAVCVVGVVIITFQPGDYLRFGAFLVLGSSLLYALHAAVVKRYGARINFI
jgi:drug/metabolite transporter (DMT)-like permease